MNNNMNYVKDLMMILNILLDKEENKRYYKES